MTNKILSCDWGTTSFRLRLIDVNTCQVLQEVNDGKGIAALYNDWVQTNQPESGRVAFYKNVLQFYINRFNTEAINDVPVIISGMASSTIGITELPYSEIPFNLESDKLTAVKMNADENCKHPVLLVSGLKTDNDAMRGEETMLLGCNFKQREETLAIFPGTHSKHVSVKNQQVENCKTFMTGEVFELLSTKSILSKSVIKNASDAHQNHFKSGLKEGAEGNLLNSLFHVRTNQLNRKHSTEENYHYLSGLVIGTEFKDIAGYKGSIHLVCSDSLSELYLLALKTICKNANISYSDASLALINGHCRLSKYFL